MVDFDYDWKPLETAMIYHYMMQSAIFTPGSHTSQPKQVNDTSDLWQLNVIRISKNFSIGVSNKVNAIYF